MTKYYPFLFLLSISFVVGYSFGSLFNLFKPVMPAVTKTICKDTLFYAEEMDADICCKTAILTHCGLTLAFCDTYPMLICQKNVYCISGPGCTELPEWIKRNSASIDLDNEGNYK